MVQASGGYVGEKIHIGYRARASCICCKAAESLGKVQKEGRREFPRENG